MSQPEPQIANLNATVAGLDLGSNSFHMVVGEMDQGRIQIRDRLKETVRLGAGLDSGNKLTDDAIKRGLDCLNRFSQRVAHIPSNQVRVVGTNALRRARNSRKFLAAGSKILGHPIEVISGSEEARLIYTGVAHSLFDDQDQRLVVDIGGGSTEFVIGRGFKPKRLESLFIGCVSISQRFFADDKITRKGMNRAMTAVMQELEVIQTDYLDLGWQSAVGSSGTVHAVYDLLNDQASGITAEGLKVLREKLIDAGRSSKLGSLGVSEDRCPVFAGGVAIMGGIFQSLEIREMRVSHGALREGLLYDLQDRLNQRDIRDDTVDMLMMRYQVDPHQAARVSDSADKLFQQIRGNWKLDAEVDGRLLEWAAKLHEIGMSISHQQYHKHGEYLVRHHDMRGFSKQEQALLAAMIRGHRRKVPRTVLEDLPDDKLTTATRLGVLLRLAVVLNRSRNRTGLRDLKLETTRTGIALRFPKGWLKTHPLTVADLEQEADYLKAIDLKLEFE